ncbi:MAG: DUF2145 domain-containing protein [Desulfamplus sp.]|nr:DUF2145 domain-containing protein [Desulfamplus sp.]
MGYFKTTKNIIAATVNIKIILRCKIILFSLTILSIYFGSAIAGSSQSEGPIQFKPEEIIKFAKKVEKRLAEKGAKVAIIARVGRPRNKLPEGISFTHTAIAVYSQITTADKRKIPGYAIYNLYQKDDKPEISDLIVDYPVDFFAGVYLLEAGIIIPSPELQKRMLAVITSGTYKSLHNPKYSVIANPFTLDFQNCTEHTLDVIFASIYDTSNINVIKANEKAYFKPQPVKINPLKLALGSMFIADVTTSDHPESPVTATFTTIGQFLSKYDSASQIMIIQPDK